MKKQFPRMWNWRAGLFQVCIFELETIWEEFWRVLMSTLNSFGCVKLCVPRGLRSSRARGCGCKLHVPGFGDFFWDFHGSVLAFLLPGDSKSIKFLGVFGVDCFFSKFDAFLTKAPETAKTHPLELNDSTLSSSCLKAVSPLSMLHTAWEAVVSRLFHWEKQSRSPHRAFAKHGLYLINWKRWKLPAKLPQKAAKLPQKQPNSRKSRKVVDLCLVAIGCKNEAKVSSQLEVKHPWYVRQKWFA